MATAIFDTHAFVKRLTAAGMPVEQAEILADEHARLLGEQLATEARAFALLRADGGDGAAHQGSAHHPLGVMLAGAIAIVAALVKLL